MILSMTGYGRRTFELNSKNAVVEIRALNSKTFDLNLRLAPLFRDQEMELRNILSKRIVRGKTDCSISYEVPDEKNGELNTDAVKSYYRQLKDISQELNIPSDHLFDLVFRLPNITQTSKEELTEEQSKFVCSMVEAACDQLNKFRSDEGANLKADLLIRVDCILSALNDVEKINPERIENQRAKMTNDLRTMTENDQMDKNRFEEELIYYLEKMDINEEVTRLKSHCTYFLDTLKEEASEKGKKLGFISQEMGREINTIGSKAYHAGMQKCVVMMKDELEKIKEQLNNVL